MNHKTFIAGGTGGASMVIVGHPLDTIKVRIQNDAGGRLYGGIADCVRKVVRTEGPAALCKGISLPLAATSSVFALCFCGSPKPARLLGGGRAGGGERPRVGTTTARRSSATPTPSTPTRSS